MNVLSGSVNGVVMIFLGLMGIALLLALILVAWVFLKVRRLHIPAAADFFETLRMTPISVVLMLDLLDLALDVFSAPISWLILDRLNLKPLRTVTVLKDLIPFSDVLPMMTLAWFLARLLPDLHVPANAPRLVKLLVG